MFSEINLPGTFLYMGIKSKVLIEYYKSLRKDIWQCVKQAEYMYNVSSWKLYTKF